MRIFSLILLANLCGCSQSQLVATPNKKAQILTMQWPKDWSIFLGQTVTLEGKAANAKLGALLESDQDMIWIDGMDSWPDGFYPSRDQGKSLRVTGVVIKKADMPVYVKKPGELTRAGIPVNSEEELQRRKWRFLLKDATWIILD